MRTFSTLALPGLTLVSMVAASPIDTSFANPTGAGWANPVKDISASPTSTTFPHQSLADWDYGPRPTGIRGKGPIGGDWNDPMCFLKAKRQIGGKPAKPDGFGC